MKIIFPHEYFALHLVMISVKTDALIFQITQLKIASNPFAKGFRDCDPEDW